MYLRRRRLRKCCKMVYVGETYWRLYDRNVEHKQSVTNGKDCPVRKYFLEANRRFDNMKVTVLFENIYRQKTI